ncbi:MAG TPA: hypothetical protein EYP10_00205 [Armatimonadetes bacterium]|nr:hypothetical protein [Armatimonadota bacterium]
MSISLILLLTLALILAMLLLVLIILLVYFEWRTARALEALLNWLQISESETAEELSAQSTRDEESHATEEGGASGDVLAEQ